MFMKNTSHRVVVTVFLLLLFTGGSAQGQEYEKIAQTGFQFLSVVSDAKAAALGEALSAVESQSSALFFNPAGMARLPNTFDISLSQNSWIADINHNAFSLAVNPAEGRYGVFGVSLQFVDYGEVQGTMVWDNEQGYIKTEVMNPSAYAVGIGYAKALSDRFSVGGHIRTTHQYLGRNVVLGAESEEGEERRDLGKNTAGVVTFDFGTIYQTNFKSLAFGMNVKNFSKEIAFEDESFQLPLIFNLGISMNLFDFVTPIQNFGNSLYLSVDATHPRSHAEQIKVGLDYTLLRFLSLRGGYIANNDEEDFTFGFGVSQFGLTLDYAYTPFGVFGNVQRMTARFTF